MSRIVQENVRPAGAPLENIARNTGDVIPSRLLGPSRIEMVPRNDGSGKEWRNEVGDLVLKDPNSDRLYIQRAVILNWHTERGSLLADLDVNIPSLDIDPATGEVIEFEALLGRVKEFLRSGAMSSETADASTSGAVFEEADAQPEEFDALLGRLKEFLHSDAMSSETADASTPGAVSEETDAQPNAASA